MSDYFDRIERQIVARVETASLQRPRRRLRVDLALPALGAIVVVAIALVFLGLRHAPTTTPTRPAGAVTLVYRAQPMPQTPVLTRAALTRAVAGLRARTDALGVTPVTFHISGDHITVALSNPANLPRVEHALAEAPTLTVSDWEANVLTPSGTPVAAALQASDGAATVMSQGSSAATGTPGAGSMPLYSAVRLAARQPLAVSPDNTRPGSQYYRFGAPHSRACARAAQDAHTPALATTHCLLSGPANSLAELDADRPAGVSAAQGVIFVVRRGTIILQAHSPLPLGAPGAGYYVLRDHAALLGAELTHPQVGTDATTGRPNVTFGFNAAGAAAFQALTKTLAHRGDLLSGLNHTLNQHAAVALNGKLISVLSVDFKTYPDGVSGESGAAITGDLTTQSARDLASEMSLSAFPIGLALVSVTRTFATG